MKITAEAFHSKVKTRRAPSRYCRDAMVFSRTTTALRGNEYPPPISVVGERVHAAHTIKNVLCKLNCG